MQLPAKARRADRARTTLHALLPKDLTDAAVRLRLDS
jgi:hypothetical protein